MLWVETINQYLTNVLNNKMCLLHNSLFYVSLVFLSSSLLNSAPTVGTQGGDSFPSGGPAKVTVPAGHPSAPVPGPSQGWGRTCTCRGAPEPHQAQSPLSLFNVDYPPIWGDLRGIHIPADIPWPPRILQPHHHALCPPGM